MSNKNNIMSSKDGFLDQEKNRKQRRHLARMKRQRINKYKRKRRKQAKNEKISKRERDRLRTIRRFKQHMEETTKRINEEIKKEEEEEARERRKTREISTKAIKRSEKYISELDPEKFLNFEKDPFGYKGFKFDQIWKYASRIYRKLEWSSPIQELYDNVIFNKEHEYYIGKCIIQEPEVKSSFPFPREGTISDLGMRLFDEPLLATMYAPSRTNRGENIVKYKETYSTPSNKHNE